MNGAQEGVVFLLLSRGDPTNFDVLTLKFQPTESVMGDRYRITDFRIIPEPSTVCIPKTRFPRNHGHLSRRISSRGVARRGAGMGTRVSVGVVE